MDQIKIGQFIKSIRKEKSFTQRELAEKLNVSEKTISKWETGNGLPEVSLMLPLCKILGVSVNELLSGERLNETRYFEKAEENILSLAADRTSPKTKVIVSTVSCILVVLSCLAIILLAALLDLPIWVRLVLLGLSVLIVAAEIAVILLVAVSAEIYECAHCREKFVPTLTAYFLSPHTFKRRYLKCPRCGKRSWNKSNVKKQ